MSPYNLLLYLGAAAVVTISPGPDILTVITRSVAQGTRAGIVATFGFATGLIFHTTLAATGLALVLHQSPRAFRVVQFAGAAYLAYLGIMLIAKSKPIALTELPPLQLRRIYVQSILMNILNPKVTLFFVAFLSDFRDEASPIPPWGQFTILGALFAVCTILIFGTCAVTAGTLAEGMRKRPKAGVALQRFAGAVFLVLAVLLVID